MIDSKQAGRPQGSRNNKPTKAAIAGYFRMLRAKADKGDTYAAAKLIELDMIAANRKETANDR